MEKKPSLAAGLDLGSAFTRCVICRISGERLHFLGFGVTESAGWVKSRVADQRAVCECASTAVQQAEAMAGVQLENVVAGFGGLTVRGANTRSRIEVGRPREIDQRDVNRALERASRVQLQEDRMVLQLFPQDFVVDDHPGHRDPRNMLASAFEANAHLITVSTQEHNTVIGAVNQAHLSLEETVFEGLAACYAAVRPEERNDGIAVVDIGAGSTEMAVYFGEALQLAATLKISGDHFTRDIAHYLRIRTEEADIIKQEYGSAVSDSTAENSFVELPAIEGRAERDAPRRRINEIIEARAVDLFTVVRKELIRVGMHRALTGGLVLTGGGAMLHGICDIAERVIDCQARIGLPTGVMGWPEELTDPRWTAVAGLAMYSGRLKTRAGVDRQSVGLLSRILR